MIVNLSVDTTQPLSDQDKIVLLALQGEISLAPVASGAAVIGEENLPVEAEPVVVEETPSAAAVEETSSEEAKPQRRRRTRCKTCGELHFADEACATQTTETEAPVTTAVSEPEPAPAEAEEVASPSPDEDAPSLREQAVRIATELVAAGKAGDVRKVLNEIGVRRVSEIAEEDLQTFLDAIAA